MVPMAVPHLVFGPATSLIPLTLVVERCRSLEPLRRRWPLTQTIGAFPLKMAHFLLEECSLGTRPNMLPVLPKDVSRARCMSALNPLFPSWKMGWVVATMALVSSMVLARNT